MSKDKTYTTLEQLGVTPFQRRNLERLYSRTEEFLTDPHFTMERYSDSDEPYEKEARACGTVACFSGHGPKVGILARNGESWESYTTRSFGGSLEVWNWLFSAGWSYVDDTLHGARSRLRIALDKGVPSDAMEQKWGEDPLEYDDAAA